MTTLDININGEPAAILDFFTALVTPISVNVEQLREPAPAVATVATGRNTPPPIGQPWPGQGGTYAGLSRGVDGQPDAHLITANATPLDDVTWDAAVTWAQAVDADGHGDFRLPTRAESALLFANLKDVIEARWHWTGEQYSRTLAWFQDFVGGGQYYGDKSYEGRARAVRRFIP